MYQGTAHTGRTFLPVDLHTHSIASGHGTRDTLTDLAKEAASRGMQVLGISDHGPATPGGASLSYFRSLIQAPESRFHVRILKGAEANILEGGELDIPEEIRSRLDFCIVSMHHPPRRDLTPEENTKDYLCALSLPFVTILGHCDGTRFPLDYEAVTDACLLHRVIVELNEVSLGDSGYHQFPGTDIRANCRTLAACCQRKGIPVLLSSDSHGRAGIGAMDNALALAREAGIPDTQIVNFTPSLLRWKDL